MPKRKPRDTASSLAEVARHFDVSERTVAGWRARGMPGRPRCYPLAEIAEWRGRELRPPPDEDLRKRKQRVEIETAQLKLDRLRGRLLELEPVRRMFVRHVHECKAILDQLPDSLLATLPPKTPARTRRRVRGDVARVIDDAVAALSDLLDELTPDPAE